MMTTPLPRASAFHIAARAIACAAATTMAIACAQSDATAPTNRGALGPAALAMSAAASASGRGPQACTPDAKLLGRFAVSTADTPGTWWRLTKDRFDALGVTDYKAALEGFYGLHFANLDAAVQYLIAGVASYDANGNGYVCAFGERGTRAVLGVNVNYLLGIADDKHVED